MAVLTRVHHSSILAWTANRYSRMTELVILCTALDAGDADSTESLFMRELKRRGLSSSKAGKPSFQEPLSFPSFSVPAIYMYWW